MLLISVQNVRCMRVLYIRMIKRVCDLSLKVYAIWCDPLTQILLCVHYSQVEV
jgi:hypothetical protein